MVQFSDEDKVEKEFKNNYFSFGVHMVKTGGFVIDEDDKGREYITIIVMDLADPDISAEVRMWLHTDGARNFTFNTLRQIYVHNAPADQKDAARSTFDKIEDGMALLEVLSKITPDGEAWIDVYPDPERTYTNKNGETKPSINTNVYGYEPKVKLELIPAVQQALKADDYAEGDVPFGSTAEEKAKAAKGNSTVPSKW